MGFSGLQWNSTKRDRLFLFVKLAGSQRKKNFDPKFRIPQYSSRMDAAIAPGPRSLSMAGPLVLALLTKTEPGPMTRILPQYSTEMDAAIAPGPRSLSVAGPLVLALLTKTEPGPMKFGPE